MDRRVYQVSFVVFSALAILLPTLTKQANDGRVGGSYSDKGRVLGVSCGGDSDLVSDLNCDGEINLSDFNIWRRDYLNSPEPVVNSPTPTLVEEFIEGCTSSSQCSVLATPEWHECNQVACLNSECVYSMKGDGTSCITLGGDGGSCSNGECVVSFFGEAKECNKSTDCMPCGNDCVAREADLFCPDVLTDFSCKCDSGNCVKVSDAI